MAEKTEKEGAAKWRHRGRGGHREMEKTYRIYPILTSKFTLDKGMFTYLRNYGEKMLVPVFAWLVLGGQKAFLVDTGCSLADWMKGSRHASGDASGGEEGIPLEDSLQRLGVAPSDIDTVILTHLHRDHFLNAGKFPKARIIVQEKELDFAMSPHPLFAGSYNKEWYKAFNFQPVAGDTEIFPGIELIATPGHTVGSQSVSVKTTRGRVVICGFCSIDENFGAKEDLIPGLHIDPRAAYDSIVKLRKTAGTIIPLHSQAALEVECYS